MTIAYSRFSDKLIKIIVEKVNKKGNVLVITSTLSLSPPGGPILFLFQNP